MSGVCRVHELLYKDTTPRDVKFCPLCNHWMCDDCRGNWGRRALAAVMERLR